MNQASDLNTTGQAKPAPKVDLVKEANKLLDPKEEELKKSSQKHKIIGRILDHRTFIRTQTMLRITLHTPENDR